MPRFRNAPAARENGSGLGIQYSEEIRTDGGELLTLPDGSTVEMRAHSELSLERATDGIRIRLSKGGVIVNAAKQRTGHLYVQTKDVNVSVLGAVFLVNAEEEGSRVAVIEGEVRVQQGATEKKLRPGEQVASSPSMQSIPVKEEISWSRNAEAHLALLKSAEASAATSPQQNPTEAREAFEVASVRPHDSPPAANAARTLGSGQHQAVHRPVRRSSEFVLSKLSVFRELHPRGRSWSRGSEKCSRRCWPIASSSLCDAKRDRYPPTH